MKLGFYNYYQTYNNNKMFEDSSSLTGDNLNSPFIFLRKYAREKNINVSTIDTEPLQSYDAIVFLDYPKKSNNFFKHLIDIGYSNLYLVLFESEIIRPDNYDPSNHIFFKKIFTWNDKLVDNKVYIKFFWPNDISNFKSSTKTTKSKLITMISGNKYSSHPKELYSERVAAIRWFEKNHPDEFDLFGFGWDKFIFTGSLTFLNSKKFDFSRKIFKSRYKSYRGQVESKYSTLSNYKFSICYENAIDIPGYITEKIFDCFFAGCVPIYLGPKNINEHIPPGTYIDKREFKSYEDLYEYISNMNDNEYNEYLENIRVFLESDAAYPFDVEYFASTLVSEILKDV